MTDLHDELGVSRDADEKAIRAAFRRRSKETHPDAGGEPGAFERTQTALMVLTHPGRRKKYDETGEIEQEPIDNAYAAAVGLIDHEMGQIVNAYIANGFREQDDPRNIDLIDVLKIKIAGKAAADQRMIETGKQAVRFYRDMAKRLKMRKGAKTTANPLSRRFDDLVRQSEQSLAELVRSIEDAETALKILDDYDFEHDERTFYGTQVRGWSLG